MLMVNQATGFGAGAEPPPPAISAFQGAAALTGNQSAYSFTNRGLGTPTPDRRILLWAGGTRSGTASFGAVTIAGVTATLLDSIQAANRAVGMFIAHVPEGTSGDISVGFGDGMLQCGIAVWAVYNLLSAVPVDTVLRAVVASACDFPALATAEDGVAVWACLSSTGTASFTWSTGTERFDAVVEGAVTHSGADMVTTGASVTMTATGSASSLKDGIGVSLR